LISSSQAKQNAGYFLRRSNSYCIVLQILHLLYEKDIITEEAIEDWESEKKDADEADRVFVKQAEIFLKVCIRIYLSLNKCDASSNCLSFLAL